MTIVNCRLVEPAPQKLPKGNGDGFGDKVRLMASDSKTRRYVDALWRVLEPYKGQNVRLRGFTGHPIWLHVALEYGIPEASPEGYYWALYGDGVLFPVERFIPLSQKGA